MDNEVVATSWLAFTGYSDIARNEKRRIFAEDKVYTHIFEKIPAQHGYQYKFDRRASKNDDNSQDQIPPASNLLLATLVHLCAKQCSRSGAELNASFIEEHNLGDRGLDEQKAELSKIPEFLAAQMMASSPFLFTELFGYMFLQIPIEKRRRAAMKILQESDLREVYEKKNFSDFKSNVGDIPGVDDLFRAYHQLWSSIMSEFAESGAFRTDLLNASSRPSFTHSAQTRNKLFGRILEYDLSIEKRGRLDKPWSSPFDERGSISKALKVWAT